ncbi:hypothetical protein FRB90_000623 [Tulasnella sp. 427]|nr:hypothetical protein FRB90_000623 [Tulasnella sp. 427]
MFIITLNTAPAEVLTSNVSDNDVRREETDEMPTQADYDGGNGGVGYCVVM